MKSEQLAHFAEVAKLEHLGQAAARLRLTPSAVSHSLRQLEAEIGYPLFEKRGRSIFLTAHGRALLPFAEGVLGKIEEARSALQRAELPWSGRLSLGASHGLPVEKIAYLAAEIQRASPDLQLTVLSARSAQVIESVVGGELDWGIALSPNPHPELDKRVLAKIPLSIVVRKEHPLVRKRGLKSVDFDPYPMAAPRAFAGVEVCERHPELVKRGLTPDPSFLFDSYGVAAHYLAGSNAWGLLPLNLVEETARKRLQELTLPGWRVQIEVASLRRTSRARTPPMQKLESALSDELRVRVGSR